MSTKHSFSCMWNRVVSKSGAPVEAKRSFSHLAVMLGSLGGQDSVKMALRWGKDGPRWLKMAPRWPQDVPRCPKIASRWPKDGPSCLPPDSPKMAPRWPQDGPRCPKIATRWPREAQYGRTRAQYGSKMAARWSQVGSTLAPRWMWGWGLGARSGFPVEAKRSFSHLGVMLGSLGPSWGILWASWAILGHLVGIMGHLRGFWGHRHGLTWVFKLLFSSRRSAHLPKQGPTRAARGA